MPPIKRNQIKLIGTKLIKSFIDNKINQPMDRYINKENRLNFPINFSLYSIPAKVKNHIKENKLHPSVFLIKTNNIGV